MQRRKRFRAAPNSAAVLRVLGGGEGVCRNEK